MVSPELMSAAGLGTLRIATRGSALALAQTGLVAAALAAGTREVELVTVRTTGDADGRELTAIGGTGVFVGEVRTAVLDGRADVAVHSYKDLPVAAVAGLVIGAVPERADAADVLVRRAGRGGDDSDSDPADIFGGLPARARIGTGSPRRATQLLALAAGRGLAPVVVPVRGNVGTRLGLVADGTLDAVVVAAAGLHRLGLGGAPGPGLVGRRFDTGVLLPAPAQGALAVECREDAGEELLRAVAGLDHAPTRAAVTAERSVLAALDAGCTTPIGALASAAGPGQLLLRACLADPAGRLTRVEVDGPVTAPELLGARAAARLVPGNDPPDNDPRDHDHAGHDHPGNDHPGNDHPGNDHPGNHHPGNHPGKQGGAT